MTGRTADRDQDRTVSDAVAGQLFDRLAGPDGLTATASTFARPDVLVALGAGLAGATRTELEELTDQFLAERAVSVVADRALEERRWSTPDLLAVEQRLVTAATGRTDKQVAVVSHQAVRDALAAHRTAGQDQQAMVRDLCQGGAGVAVVVGRAGTGKTFALGIARHAWQLDGYRLLASAPTGIATMSLHGRLGPERLQVEDRQLAVGDRVVCGHNAIGELEMANGSRGTITALDPKARTLTLRLDGSDGREVILPRSYLDGRRQGERNRRVDLAYATTTGHRAQGLPAAAISRAAWPARP